MVTFVFGYRTNASLSPSVFALVLQEIKQEIEKKQRQLMAELLSEEINLVADYYALNYLQIEQERSIWDVALERVGSMVQVAGRNKNDIKYNLNVSLEFMPYGGKWYILVVSYNERLSEGLLDNVKRLERCYVVRSDQESEEYEKAWREIEKDYNDKRQPLRQFYPPDVSGNNITFDQIKLENINDRAKYHAHNMEFSRLFGMYAGGRQIPPVEFLRYAEGISDELENSGFKSENIQTNYDELLRILPELTQELIMQPRGILQDPQDPEAADNNDTPQE